jgi:TldD protein
MEEATWNRAIDEAIKQALTNLRSVDAPAGEMHRAARPRLARRAAARGGGPRAGGDFNRKGTSAFSGRIGERSRRRA